MRDVSVWAVSNPALAVQFERRGGGAGGAAGVAAGAASGGGLLTLDAWVDVNALAVETNAVADVCRRGFSVAEGAALEVAVGSIAFPENGQSERGGAAASGSDPARRGAARRQWPRPAHAACARRVAATLSHRARAAFLALPPSPQSSPLAPPSPAQASTSTCCAARPWGART